MTASTLTITEFLLARIAEDESDARDDGADAMTGARWKHFAEDAYEELQAVTLGRCRRVLADCEAKRRIVERCVGHLAGWPDEDPDIVRRSMAAGQAQSAYANLRDLASMYADHPDFDVAWRR